VRRFVHVISQSAMKWNDPHRIAQVGNVVCVRMRHAREHAFAPGGRVGRHFTMPKLCRPAINMTRARAMIILALMGFA